MALLFLTITFITDASVLISTPKYSADLAMAMLTSPVPPLWKPHARKAPSISPMVAFSGSNSNHSSKKSAELIVISFVKYSNCCDVRVLIWSNNLFELKRSDKEGLIALGAIVSSIGLTAIPIWPIRGPNRV